MTKKILFLITKSNFGGAQRYVFDLATNISKDKYEVVVASGGQGTLQEKLRQENIRTLVIEKLGRDINIIKDAASLFSIFSIIKTERPDILHLNSPKAGAFGALAGRFFGIKKIIYTNHGWAFNEDRNIIQKIFIKFFSWITILLTHQTLLLTQIEFNQVKNWPLISKRLKVVPLGVNSIDFIAREKAREKITEIIGRAIPVDAFLVGTIAELHPNKGLSYAIDACARLPVIYIIISDGEERRVLENQIVSLKANNIFLAGRIENAASLIKAFDIFLLPSIKEGLPYVLLESALAEVPIIATSVGGIPQIIKNLETGLLVNPKISNEISGAIEFGLNNPYKIRQFATNLKTLVIDKYSLKTLMSELDNIYEQIELLKNN